MKAAPQCGHTEARREISPKQSGQGDKVGIRADKFVAARSALDGLTNEVWCKFVFLVAMRTFDVHDFAVWVKDFWAKKTSDP